MRNATQKIMRVNNALAKIRLNKHKTGGGNKKIIIICIMLEKKKHAYAIGENRYVCKYMY